MTQKILCSECLNSSCFIKQFCLENEALKKDIEKKIITNHYQKGQLIFGDGYPVEGIRFVQSGRVKVIKKGAFNKDQIIRLVSNGGILGHRGLSGNKKNFISARAICESTICFFDRDFFYDILNRSPQLTINLMFFFANELSELESKLRDFAVFNVREKVAKALIMVEQSFGLSENNEINFMQELSRKDLAELVGLTSNQVTKVLAEFKEDKIIELDNKKIKIVDYIKLKKIISY
ncbi:MAG: Crp/Fnr family transcriptional regulator [Bacteroidia bacterium]|nr:Crp/Fnr family transcriptional regulator [Bacteroidia bacterium]